MVKVAEMGESREEMCVVRLIRGGRSVALTAASVVDCEEFIIMSN